MVLKEKLLIIRRKGREQALTAHASGEIKGNYFSPRANAQKATIDVPERGGISLPSRGGDGILAVEGRGY